MASLVGPPEIYGTQKSTSTTQTSAPTVSNPFMDLMVANFNSTKTQSPNMGYTENMSVTYLSTSNPCLDFFFHVVPNTPPQSLTKYLQCAWNHDSLTALKLICNLRGVRGTGKSDKEGYYTAALWLHQFHPKTLACNLESVANFGYFKDLPEILYRLLEGADVRKKAKKEKKKGKKWKRFKSHGEKDRGWKPFGGIQVSNESKAEIEKQKASSDREQKKIDMAKKAFERYRRDPDYRFLHERVSDLFADCLKLDLELLNTGKLKDISLAAKWCPSLDSSFDKRTLLCESIARKVFTRESHPEYEGIEDAHYAYRVRDRLRKEVLVPLRKALELPEVYIGRNDWGSIPYNRVASVAMKLYKDKFLKHDEERFKDYLEKVKQGKAKIAAGALLPHQIIQSLKDTDDGGQVAELQWKRMVDDLSQKGKLKNCLAICDVSGSMSGTPMEVSVALGILVSELSVEPWKGKLITFSKNPKLQLVEGEDLRSKVGFVRNMEWGMNTDFQKVFDLILKVAVNGKLKEDEMIKKVFVFSDMEFDQVSAYPWETDYQTIVRKFNKKGYGNCVPQIVFWNLRDSRATPVTANQNGVALVSGFSKNLLTLFLEERDFHPQAIMEAAISGEEYQKLVVLD
ncbi:uncharacterized protein [Nicotiana tomentosiformis]|uniref:uncharacterized protein n=1 Tax=Nicotiana tomentosiformis TaxID=4098 RepID=UPI00051AF4A2|nr:uncharacterized protein LOC104092178 [Nicotiana tomentosiformis]